MSFDIGDAASSLGRTETRLATAHPEPAGLLLATLDRDDRRFAPADPLPLLWHWLYFPPTTRQGLLGADGHTHDSGLLPAAPAFPRRMWAGSRLRLTAPLRIGDRLSRHSTIAQVAPKIGKSGRLLFITLRHDITSSSGGAIIEEQDLVFRGPSEPSGSSHAKPVAATRPAELQRTVTPLSTLLFRFSALTFNAHRIHYDHPYATAVEGYESLVVHGPLIAVLMLDLIERARPDRSVAAFEFRAQQPAFAPHPLTVKASASANGFDVWVESRGVIVSTGGVALGAAFGSS